MPSLIGANTNIAKYPDQCDSEGLGEHHGGNTASLLLDRDMELERGVRIRPKKSERGHGKDFFWRKAEE